MRFYFVLLVVFNFVHFAWAAKTKRKVREQADYQFAATLIQKNQEFYVFKKIQLNKMPSYSIMHLRGHSRVSEKILPAGIFEKYVNSAKKKLMPLAYSSAPPHCQNKVFLNESFKSQRYSYFLCLEELSASDKAIFSNWYADVVKFANGELAKAKKI
jgi:hypothetical protein